MAWRSCAFAPFVSGKSGWSLKAGGDAAVIEMIGVAADSWRISRIVAIALLCGMRTSQRTRSNDWCW
jgi:hypothetical protein